MKRSLIFLAGGIGSRFGGATPKQFLPLNNKPLALHSFEVLTQLDDIEEVVVVCASEFRHFFSTIHPLKFAQPGAERYLSVKNGLSLLSSQETLVLIHDAARPLILKKDVETLLHVAKEAGAATLAAPITQTVKETDGTTRVTRTVPRANLWEIHTPQCVRKSLLHEGFAYQATQAFHVTDDVSLIEALGKPVELVPSSSTNIKITRQEDYHVVQALL